LTGSVVYLYVEFGNQAAQFPFGSCESPTFWTGIKRSSFIHDSNLRISQKINSTTVLFQSGRWVWVYQRLVNTKVQINREAWFTTWLWYLFLWCPVMEETWSQDCVSNSLN
jgi:hypothetical protein